MISDGLIYERFSPISIPKFRFSSRTGKSARPPQPRHEEKYHAGRKLVLESRLQIGDLVRVTYYDVSSREVREITGVLDYSPSPTEESIQVYTIYKRVRNPSAGGPRFTITTHPRTVIRYNYVRTIEEVRGRGKTIKRPKNDASL